MGQDYLLCLLPGPVTSIELGSDVPEQCSPGVFQETAIWNSKLNCFRDVVIYYLTENHFMKTHKNFPLTQYKK